MGGCLVVWNHGALRTVDVSGQEIRLGRYVIENNQTCDY